MELNEQSLPKTGPGLMPAIRPLIYAVIACAVIIFLFAPIGVIYKHADLSFLVIPFVSYFILRLCAKLSSRYLPVYSTLYAAEATTCILNGLAFSLFFYLVLGNAELFTRIGAFKNGEKFFTALSATTGYVLLFILGRTVSKLAELSRGTEWGKPLYPPANALGEFFTGIGLWQFAAAFSGYWAPLNEIGLVIFAGMLAVAVANIGHYGEDSKNPFFADAAHWLQSSITFEFIIGAFIAAYIVFIRPFITDKFPYAAFVEFGIVCLLGWRLFSGIKNGIRTRCAVDVFETDWRKHIQIIENLQGADFPRLGEIQETFIEDGSRDALLIYLTLLLYKNRVSLEEIFRILHPMINHQDARMPWFSFKWEQRRVLKKNENIRRALLDEIIANLKYIMDPASQKIEEHRNEENKPG